jgi:hypothetical protein
MSEKQMIYHYYGRIAWQKRRGNGHINVYKDVEFVSRAEDKEQMNKDAGFLMQIMSFHGLTGSKIVNFRVEKIYERKEMGRSFFYEKDN